MIYPAPSYLRELVTEVDNEILLKVQENYGEYSTAFKFNMKFKGLIQTWNTKYNCIGETVWGLSLNNEKICIFDGVKNGYEGLMGLKEAEDLNSTRTIDFGNEADIIVVFQYSGDEAEFIAEFANEGIPVYEEEDYFSWIAIYKYENNNLKEIVDYECA